MPVSLFATAEYGPKGGGIQVMSSHLSLAFNGIKMAYNRLALSGDPEIRGDPATDPRR
ncbi:MAG: hypothetical protein U0528_14900 [Anaerolineae bacterium]